MRYNYKIILDSCGELPDEFLKDERFEIVPLGLEVGEYRIQDDENFNQREFLQKVAEYSGCPKSSCPSPERFMEAYNADVERVYCITLSSHLSGSYNSAMVGIDLYEEKYGRKNIHVIDSESASCGETQIAMKIMELEERKLPFKTIVTLAEEFRSSMHTYFILDNLETLRKNGRLTGVKALVVSTLNIKPIMMGNKGVIQQRSQSVGMKKALSKLADIINEEVKNKEERTLMITHCNAPERAELLKKFLLERADFKNVRVMDTRGVSSMYANDGGVIVTA